MIPVSGNLQASGHQPQTFKLPALCWGHQLHYNEPSGAGGSGQLPLGGCRLGHVGQQCCGCSISALPSHGKGIPAKGDAVGPQNSTWRAHIGSGCNKEPQQQHLFSQGKDVLASHMVNTSSRAVGHGASSPRAGSQCPRTAGATGQQLSPGTASPPRCPHPVVFPPELSTPPSAPAKVRQQVCELL